MTVIILVLLVWVAFLCWVLGYNAGHLAGRRAESARSAGPDRSNVGPPAPGRRVFDQDAARTIGAHR